MKTQKPTQWYCLECYEKAGECGCRRSTSLTTKKPTKRGTLQRLLQIVDEAYPEGLIGVYVDLKTGKPNDLAHGDTLAQFVATETVEVGAEGSLEDRRISVACALRTAVRELEAVITALEAGK